MADGTIVDFEELLDKAIAEGGEDFLREAVAVLAERLMELEATKLAGAKKHERTSDRRDHRNGYRTRRWDTRVGTIQLQIPKLRRTPFVPAFLEPRRRGEKALVSVVQEAYVHGVSTRKVDDLVRAMGLEGVSKSQVSRICKDLDDQVERFRSRPLQGRYPYLWLDAKYEKVRVDGRVVSNALVAAYAVNDDGQREVIGVDVGGSEDEAFWKQFLRSLVERGLTGVQLVISDAHAGLKRAIREVLVGASWQRCRVHFMRNVLSRVPRKAQPLVSATVKMIFAAPDQEAARDQLRQVAATLSRTYPKVAELIEQASEDVIAYMAFPRQHWRQLHSTNPLERLNREINRRTTVVGIFPNPASLVRLVGALLIEQNDEWEVARRYFSQRSMALLYASGEGNEQPLLLEGTVAA